jgi:hypothetical protein
MSGPKRVCPLAPTNRVNPPARVDERGQPRPSVPARTASVIPILSVPSEHLRSYGWQPSQLWSVVEWCGHRVEGMPVSDADGRGREGDRARVYLYSQTRGPAFNLKFYQQLLVVTLDSNGLVKDSQFTSSGQR